ncbi:fumarylacetoacetate hydrolase family protein [bacterium RCC_150]
MRARITSLHDGVHYTESRNSCHPSRKRRNSHEHDSHEPRDRLRHRGRPRYYSHADESKKAAGLDVPKVPMIFGRWAQSLTVKDAVVPVAPKEPGLDWELELAAVVKDEIWEATAGDALEYVLGYTAFNDLSARDKQLEAPQFTLGKNPDKSGPVGPVLVTADELPPGAAGLRLQSRVNGQTMQDANTDQLIHSVARIMEYITDTVTLLPGDVIATGTPGGVGIGRDPQVFLNTDDTVEVEVEGLGILRNTFATHQRIQ